MDDSPKSGLPRVVGPWIGLAVVVGTVIGSGVFIKPRAIAQSVPDVGYVALVWSLAGVFTMLGALALAEVAALFPRTGGNYVFLRDGLGRLAGFLWGWVEFWIIKSASIAALATIFVDCLHDVVLGASGRTSAWLTPTMRLGLAIGVIVVLAAVNIRGVRWGGGLQLIVTFIKISSLLALLVLPFAIFGMGDPDGVRVSLLDQPATVAFGWSGLGKAFLGVLWAYHGWMNIAPLAGEITKPQRNVPIALIGGIGVIIVLYLGANLAYCLTISLQDMGALPEGSNVAAETCGRLLGPTGRMFALGATMISVFGALNGILLAVPRLLFAMGDDGLAPHWLSAVHVRYRTPAAATAVLAGWSVLLLVGGAAVQIGFDVTKPLFDLMTDFAMFGAVVFETLAVMTIFIFRHRFPGAARVFRCPGYPLTPLVYLALPGFVLASMFVNQPWEPVVGFAFIGLGAIVYWLCFRGVRR